MSRKKRLFLGLGFCALLLLCFSYVTYSLLNRNWPSHSSHSDFSIVTMTFFAPSDSSVSLYYEEDLLDYFSKEEFNIIDSPSYRVYNFDTHFYEQPSCAFFYEQGKAVAISGTRLYWLEENPLMSFDDESRLILKYLGQPSYPKVRYKETDLFVHKLYDGYYLYTFVQEQKIKRFILSRKELDDLHLIKKIIFEESPTKTPS